MTSLVLSIFPGLDILGLGFEQEGFCVVQARDIIMGGDVRDFHPPPGRFDGVIGGDPCQSHTALANLVRAKGLIPSFPDMTGEFERVVEEAQPAWFLRENVRQAPHIEPRGYDVRTFVLDHCHLDRGDGEGYDQMRKRRFWFGTRGIRCPELRAFIDFAVNVKGIPSPAVDCGHDYIDAKRNRLRQSVTGRHTSKGMGGKPGETPGNHPGNPPRYTLDEMLELQGLPPSFFERSPFTVQAKRMLLGNAVALGTARALARAVRRALDAMDARGGQDAEQDHAGR